MEIKQAARHALLPALLKADGSLKTRLAHTVRTPLSSAPPVLRPYEDGMKTFGCTGDVIDT